MKSINPLGQAALITIGLLAALVGVMWLVGVSREAEAARPMVTAEERARLHCTAPPSASSLAAVRLQRAVEARLKAPATADFGLISFLPAGECRFNGFGHVDAQNGFGALIRTKFVGQVEYDPASDGWRVVDVSFD